MRRLKRNREAERVGWFVRLADCQSAIRQVADLRYDGEALWDAHVGT